MYNEDRANIQGDVGEVLTARALRSDLNMRVVRNLYLPIDEHFTEIDMVAISTYGVFVIENKNYNGKIYEFRDSDYWYADYGMFKRRRFLNPRVQNSLHINVLSNILKGTEFSSVYLISIIIFNDNADISSINYEDVFNLGNFIDKIKSITKEECISEELALKLYYYLLKFSNQSSEMKEQHVSLLRSNDGVRRV